MTRRKKAGPEVVELSLGGVELYQQAQVAAQQAQAAAQRLQDFISGLLAGQGYTAAYGIVATPEGPKLERRTEEG